MQFVRQSKFRHVFCKPIKKEFCLEDVRITKITWDAMFCAVNPKFFAVITEGSGGPFQVFPIEKAGRVDKDYPVVDAHRAPCTDLQWCPFNDNVIASCSDDATAKIWMIPDGGLRKNLTEPLVELMGHQKRVSAVQWHPAAGNILLTVGGDLKIILWNVATGEALIEIAGHPDVIWSVAFNHNGSKVITACKDRKLRIIDPRTGRVLQQAQGHEGVKPQRAIFLKDGRIFSCGFTKRSERMYALRDEEAMDEPIVQEEMDTSNGVMFPLYDCDTNMVYLCGKGDGNVRYYEVNSEPPFVHYINTHVSNEPQRGLAFMPKRGLDVMENEIGRIYKCTNRGHVEVLKFHVPRKSDLFQEDLYPPTAAAKPAITADEWLGGKDADPVVMDIGPSKEQIAAADASKPKSHVSKKANILMDITAASSDGSSSAAAQPQQEQRPPSASMSVTMRASIPSSGDRDSQSAAPPKRSPAPSGAPGDSGIVMFDKQRDKLEREERLAALQVPVPDPGRWKMSSKVSKVTVRDCPQERAEQRRRDRGGASVNDGATNGRHAAADDTPSDDQQRRWIERMERLERDRQPAPPGFEPPPPQQHRPVSPPLSASRQSSVQSTARGSVVGDVEAKTLTELVADVQKMKAIIRKHEQRIRYLETQLADRDSKVLDDL